MWFEIEIMNVLIAKKPSRGSGEKFPCREFFTRVDVTSGSMNILSKNPHVYAKELSPLLIGPAKGVIRFENLWQYTKVYPQLGHWNDRKQCPTKKWEEWKNTGFSRLTSRGKGIRTPPEIFKLKKSTPQWKPLCSWWEGRHLTYIQARKRIYVPEYLKLIRDSRAMKALKKKNNTECLMILDLDAPSLEWYPTGMRVTEETIRKALNDPTYPFGHGYVIAAELVRIDLEKMCNEA